MGSRRSAAARWPRPSGASGRRRRPSKGWCAMSDLRSRIASAATRVQLDWSDEHAVAVERSFRRRLRRRQMARRLIPPATALLVLVAAALSIPRLSGRHGAVPSAPAVADGLIRFDDGSTASPLGPASVLHVVSASAVAIERGGGRFVVTRNPGRLFRVEAGPVSVEVLGTRFIVERLQERARVSVEEGRVRVVWAGHARELGAGEGDLFPPEPSAAPAAEASPRVRPPTRRAASWRDLAREGDYDRAYEALMRKGAAVVRDEPAELLLAADVARLSHHPTEAVAPLKSLLLRHRKDPRAQLAAFTLGRVFLEELGRPNEAAAAFADAEALAPDGFLTQDAIAREVEAWSRAGDATRARLRAEDYLRRYPEGSRVRSVRRFGGLE